MNFAITIKIILIALSFINLPFANAHWKPRAGVKWNWILGENPNKLTV